MATEVIIAGGGFAGLAALDALGRARRRLHVRLIDRLTHSIMTPLLPDIISNRIEGEHLRHPLGDHAQRRGAEFIHANIHAIDLDTRTVSTDAGDFQGDFLILTMGAETNYFGNDAFRANAPGLKFVDEARAIRSAIERQIVRARDGGSAPPGAILVVGGGYTGFEAATHAAALIRYRTHQPYAEWRERIPIVIVELMDEVLRALPPRIREWTLQYTAAAGIEVRTGCKVEAFETERRVRLSDGSVFDPAVVIWSTGMTPGESVARLDAPKGPGKRLEVDEHLRLVGREGVFAAGDVAAARRGGEGEPVRMAVQFSLAGGKLAGRNVLAATENRPLGVFDAPDLGYVVPLAQGDSTGVVLGREMRGPVPTQLHYFMSALRSWDWRNRLGILRDLAGRPGAYLGRFPRQAARTTRTPGPSFLRG